MQQKEKQAKKTSHRDLTGSLCAVEITSIKRTQACKQSGKNKSKVVNELN